MKTDDGVSLLEIDNPTNSNGYGREHGGSKVRFDNSPDHENVRLRLARASAMAKRIWNIDVDITQKASKLHERPIGFLEKIAGKFGRKIDKHVFRLPTIVPDDSYERRTTADEQYGILWRLPIANS